MKIIPTTSTHIIITSSSSTPSVSTNTFQTPIFLFPTVNPLILHLRAPQSYITINCTVTWKGDLSQLTTMWSYNGRMITNSQKYVITEGSLLILEFIPQNVGIYECTVKHPSGWNSSRQYSISINQGKTQLLLINTLMRINT